MISCSGGPVVVEVDRNGVALGRGIAGKIMVRNLSEKIEKSI
jgi:Fe2+ transport system protein FeoA